MSRCNNSSFFYFSDFYEQKLIQSRIDVFSLKKKELKLIKIHRLFELYNNTKILYEYQLFAFRVVTNFHCKHFYISQYISV